MDIDLPAYLCSQVDWPLCKTLKISPTVYSAFDTAILGLKIKSPYSLTILIITILCAFRMINHVDSLHSSIGRGEMKTFFSLYILSNFLLFFALGFPKLFKNKAFDYLNVLQISFNSVTFFSLFSAGLTIDKIYGILGMKSVYFMQLLCSIYFSAIVTFVYIFIKLKIKELIMVITFINMLWVLMYIVTQISKLKKTREDIWGLGSLGVIFIFFAMSIVHTFSSAYLVAKLSERNLDNFFLIIVYNFMVVMMSHKYWLSTYDFEQECPTLNVV